MAKPFWLSTTLAAIFALSLVAPAVADVVYQQNFETNSSGFTGGARVGSEGYGDLGFGSKLWRHDGASTLTVSLAQTIHNAVLSFSLAAIDSWDCCEAYGPDRFKVTLDNANTLLFDRIFGNYGLPSPTSGPGITVLSYQGELGFTAGYVDTAYALTLNLGDLSAGIHQVTFLAYGPMWQAGDDESYGLDNIALTGATSMAAVPEPGSLALVSAALMALGTANRKARRTRR